MPYRTFADDKGTSWDVWDVRPARPEHRFIDRRTGESPPPADWDGVERRSGKDRREESEFRPRLSPGMVEGWLVFQSDAEKRRLAPIPESWEEFDKASLLDLWNRAKVIELTARESAATDRS